MTHLCGVNFDEVVDDKNRDEQTATMFDGAKLVHDGDALKEKFQASRGMNVGQEIYIKVQAMTFELVILHYKKGPKLLHLRCIKMPCPHKGFRYWYPVKAPHLKGLVPTMKIYLSSSVETMVLNPAAGSRLRVADQPKYAIQGMTLFNIRS